MSVIAFGDWHANKHFAIAALEEASILYPDVNTYIHVGDFGVWSSYGLFTPEAAEVADSLTGDFSTDQALWREADCLKGFLPEVNKWLRDHNKKLYVVLGNHENYWELDESFMFSGFYTCSGSKKHNVRIRTIGDPVIEGEVNSVTGMVSNFDEDGFIRSQMFDSILVAPRTHVWAWDGVTYGTLGGACSIDRWKRSEGISWWPEEQPTMDQANTLSGYNIDVLFTHDAPEYVTTQLYPSGSGGGWNAQALSYAQLSPKVVSRAVELTKPKILVCGHHHIRKDFMLPQGTKVSILSADVNRNIMNNRLLVA